MARPTKYSAQKRKTAERYLAGGYADQGDAIPSVEGLARLLEVAPQTLREWGAEHPEFSSTLESLRAEQARVTMNNGLFGIYNATICKLILANHGYSDKVEQAHSNPDGSMGGPKRVEIVPGPSPNDDSGDG